MIETTKKINDIFKSLYESERISVVQNYSYESIIESNKSRLDYLNHLFNKIEVDELSKECREILKENIDFLHDFMTGKCDVELSVPKKYFNDKEDCLIVPKPEELEYLLKLFEANREIFEILYKNSKFMIELPKNSFNQNMKRILEIQEYNLAHLLGLTESEPEPDPDKNILKKYFMSNIKNNEKYGDKISERLLNWVLSEEGRKELRRLNSITIEFINEDKKKNCNNYDEKGNIKKKSLKNFKKRFKETNGFDFSIIRFSRWLTKSINCINFLKLNNVFQIILDYNAPKGKKDEKDIFIVNCPKNLMTNEITTYKKFYEKILKIMEMYANGTDELKKEIGLILEEMGIDFNDKNIDSFINQIQAYDFIGKQGINPNKDVALEKIRNAISTYFNSNIHLIGFDTEHDNDETKLNEFTTNYAHCDTSISLTAAELVGDYYHRGRPFFLDKIYDETGKRLLRISNPQEEILYLKQMSTLDKSNMNQLEELKYILHTFSERYKMYKKIVIEQEKENENNKNKHR